MHGKVYTRFCSDIGLAQDWKQTNHQKGDSNKVYTNVHAATSSHDEHIICQSQNHHLRYAAMGHPTTIGIVLHSVKENQQALANFEAILEE